MVLVLLLKLFHKSLFINVLLDFVTLCELGFSCVESSSLTVASSNYPDAKKTHCPSPVAASRVTFVQMNGTLTRNGHSCAASHDLSSVPAVMESQSTRIASPYPPFELDFYSQMTMWGHWSRPSIPTDGCANGTGGWWNWLKQTGSRSEGAINQKAEVTGSHVECQDAGGEWGS